MKIGFTCSTFDLLHAGHVQMLREAKEQCDHLICGLQIDPSIDRKEKNSPVQTLVERYTQLIALSYVDEIIHPNRKRFRRHFENVFIDIRILGEEYKEKDFTGKDIQEKRSYYLTNVITASVIYERVKSS